MSSKDNCIKNLIGIQDKYIKKLKLIEENYKYKGLVYSIYSAKLTKKCNKCNHCNSKNIVKNGYTTSNIKDNTRNPIIIKLTKPRFKCKECKKTSTPETSYAKKYSRFSENVKLKVIEDLRQKWSQKSIAKLNFVSSSFVSRIIKDYLISKTTVYNYLPESICIDEFSCIKGMSFIFCDAKTKEVINIFSSRKNYHLTDEFNKYSEEAKNNVKIVVMDMFNPYIGLVRQIFKNAEIVIDRFHIAKLFSTALNKTRILTMSNFPISSNKYKRLKHYWRFFLKSFEKIDCINFKKFSYFNKRLISEETLIDESLSVSEELRNTYDVYQLLLHFMKKRNFKSFKNIINDYSDIVSDKMKDKFTTINKFIPYIENSFKYEYSNGPLEGINNTIKVLNKVSYGFRNFEFYKARILHTLNSPYHIISKN